MKPYSLRRRLLMSGAISIVIALSVAALGISALFRAHVERRAISELSVHLDQILSGVERDAEGALFLATAPADPRFSKPYGGLYWQIAAESRLLRSRSLWEKSITLPVDELQDGAEHVHKLDGPDGQSLLTVERSVILPRRLGEVPMRAAVAVDSADLRAATQEFTNDLLPSLLLLTLALVLASAFQVLVGLRPLGRVEAHLAAIRSGKSERLGEDFPAEIIPLAKEVDALLDERADEVSKARMRAADLAHGFKTPLQALLGEAGRLRAGGREEPAVAIEETVDVMRQHVDREMARARIALQGHRRRTKLFPIIDRISRVLLRTGEGKDKQWSIDVPKELSVVAQEDDLAEILGAVMENASIHALRHIFVSARLAEGHTRICIEDDGAGIPADRLTEMTRRGARADESAPGSGLGLAIATEIAEALGGSLSLENGANGLRACLELPTR